jgi:TniQ
MGAIAKLPFIPAPFLDETFGSWFRRCANAYHTSSSHLMSSILNTAGAASVEDPVDWDTDPPEVLLESLARQTTLMQSELEYLIVRQGPGTLPPLLRDTYCLACFDKDLASKEPYIRRAWLDAWTITCPIHGCLLGRFSEYEFKASGGEVTCFPSGPYAPPSTDGAVREQMKVHDVSVHGLRQTDAISEESSALDLADCFDPAMLQSVVGRDLLIIAGSEAANALHSELFGGARPWRCVWHDVDRKPLWWPTIHHPIASIQVRVPAAQLAGLVWNCLREVPSSRPYKDRIIDSVRRKLKLQRLQLGGPALIDRWPREERERWRALYTIGQQ